MAINRKRIKIYLESPHNMYSRNLLMIEMPGRARISVWFMDGPNFREANEKDIEWAKYVLDVYPDILLKAKNRHFLLDPRNSDISMQCITVFDEDWFPIRQDD